MTTRILATVALERVRQHIKHGDQRHLPDGTGPLWTATLVVAGATAGIRHSASTS